tara:strand:+ start:5990 stop:6625 length:636 start_codon:yes stop_codon:yes gene_type:complete
MEIPQIKIPEINIQKINVPVNNPYQVLDVPLPSLKLPGCVRYHRDASPKNTALYNDDPRGTSISCPYGSMPTFQPLLYDRRKINITEIKQEEKKQFDEQPKYKEQKIEIPKKKEEEFFIKCPDPSKDQMIGDFRNSKKLQIVSGHKIENKECITIYEDTKFIEKYLPSVKDSTTAAGIALVAATTPLLLNLIKPLVKNIIKKLTKKKNDVK